MHAIAYKNIPAALIEARRSALEAFAHNPARPNMFVYVRGNQAAILAKSFDVKDGQGVYTIAPASIPDWKLLKEWKP